MVVESDVGNDDGQKILSDCRTSRTDEGIATMVASVPLKNLTPNQTKFLHH